VKKIPWSAITTVLQQFLSEKNVPIVSEVAHKTRDPFRVLVSTVISARTKDEVTAAASERLFALASDPSALAALPEDRIAELIYPAGFYNTKAANLKRMAALLLREHQARIPNSIEALLGLPGVGRKTANLVLNLGFGIDGICVDTHVHRISNRFGWVETKTPEQTENALIEILPRKYWIVINELLVTFGQNHCTPISPRCSTCPVYAHCRRIGVGRQR